MVRVVLGVVVIADRNMTEPPRIGEVWAAPVKTIAPTATLFVPEKLTMMLWLRPSVGRLGPGS